MTIDYMARSWDELEALGGALSEVRGSRHVVDVVRRLLPRFELATTCEGKAVYALLRGLDDAL